MSIFDRYAPFLQDYIYQHNWEALRAVQVAAGDVIFNTDDNLLLCASTASGKTRQRSSPFSPSSAKIPLPLWARSTSGR